ncbi:hypothetical protein FDQ92_03295 [Desulfoglaeba alkanexedens ALDC]|uniref:Uncharacterized protein n=1 Tax=Desulfoglaeba alkanexedens ALDC TaxID=980445 RepID=A0A4P8L6M6_9BACT|nr:hypothetical protein FDQ92_03295 [Desulfoglaeba alkanexedens ALDC]
MKATSTAVTAAAISAQTPRTWK